MKSARVTIAGMMLAIVAVAAGLAVMIRPLPIVAPVVYAIAFLSLGVAVGGAISSRGRARAAWGGYLAFAGVYFVLCFAPWYRDAIEPYLPQSRALDAYYLDWMSYRPTTPGETVYVYNWPGEFREALYKPELEVGFTSLKGSSPGTVRISLDRMDKMVMDYSPEELRPCSRDSLHQVADSLGTMVFGLIGAVGAGIVAGRARRATPAPAIGVDPPIETGL